MTGENSVKTDTCREEQKRYALSDQLSQVLRDASRGSMNVSAVMKGQIAEYVGLQR